MPTQLCLLLDRVEFQTQQNRFLLQGHLEAPAVGVPAIMGQPICHRNQLTYHRNQFTLQGNQVAQAITELVLRLVVQPILHLTLRATLHQILRPTLQATQTIIAPAVTRHLLSGNGSCPSDLSPLSGAFSVQDCSAGSTILTIINIMLGFLGIVSVGFIIFGGYQMVFSAGSDEAFKKGRKTITNAIIGLVVAIFSYAIIAIISNTLNTASNYSPSSSNSVAVTGKTRAS